MPVHAFPRIAASLLSRVVGALQPWLVRRETARRSAIERLSSQMLAKGATLHAVRWQGEELLLACTDHQVTVLARRASGSAPQEQP